MNNTWRRNLPLIIGAVLPIVFIIVISIFAFTPTLFIKPQHNFVYALQKDSYGSNYGKGSYVVEGGKVVLRQALTEPTSSQAAQYAPRLFLYDVQAYASHEISITDTQQLTLDPGPTSPDGYTVEYRSGNNGIFELFDSNTNNRGWYVTKNSGAKKLPGIAIGRYAYEGNFEFIGWIK